MIHDLMIVCSISFCPSYTSHNVMSKGDLQLLYSLCKFWLWNKKKRKEKTLQSDYLQATLAEKLGTDGPQTRNNQDSFERLSQYYHRFKKLPLPQENSRSELDQSRMKLSFKWLLFTLIFPVFEYCIIFESLPLYIIL